MDKNKLNFSLTNDPLGIGNLGATRTSTRQTFTPEQQKADVDRTRALAQGIVQSTARGVGALGQTGINVATGGRAGSMLTPPAEPSRLNLYKAIYGTTAPVNFRTVGEEYPGVGTSGISRASTLIGTTQSTTPSSIVRDTTALAPFVGFAGTLLDAVPGGSGVTKTLKALEKTQDATEAARLLQRAGIKGDFARYGGEVFATIGDPKEVERAFESLRKLQRSTEKTGLTGGAEQVREALGVTNRGFTESVRETFPQVQKVAGQYIPRDTDELAKRAVLRIAQNPNEAVNLARTGTSDEAVATAAELIKKLVRDADSAPDEATRVLLHDRAAEIANDAARNLTELGRSVQAASILGRMTPEGIVRFAARSIQKYNEGIENAGNFSRTAGSRINATKVREIFTGAQKIPELSGEELARLVERARQIEALPDGVEKARAIHALMNDISLYTPTPLWKKFTTLYKAGLLTGIRTTGLNLLSNLSHSLTEGIKDIPAVVVDRVASLFTGKRTIALTGRGTIQGVEEGFKKGFDYLKTGFDERNMAAKLDYKKVSFGTGRIARGLQKYEETVFRVLGTEDQPFYYGAKARSLTSQALAEGANRGLKGDELKKFAQDLVQNPSDDMLRYATLDAQTAVFQNKTLLGRAAKAFQQIPILGDIILPFAQTPSAVATQILNYSPVGIVKTIVENIGKGRFDQRLFAQGVGRGLTGTAVAYIGSKLVEKDMIALGRPATEQERQQWELEGKKANSIKIGDRWYSVNVLGPAGNQLIAGAYFAQGLKESGSVWGGMAQGSAGAYKSLKEQTFLTGVSQAIDALNDPGSFATSFASRTIGGLVPTLVSDIARGTDEFERRQEGFLGGIKSRTPGIRQKTLEPQFTTLGSKIQTPSFWRVLLDPTRSSPATVSDPVIKELKRLADGGFMATPTKIGSTENKGFKQLTPEQNSTLLEKSGVTLYGKLTNLMQSPEYQGLDDEQKAKVIKSFTDKAKQYARAAMVVELTTGLEGEALKAKLSELKANKFMTKEVYNTFIDLR